MQTCVRSYIYIHIQEWKHYTVHNSSQLCAVFVLFCVTLMMYNTDLPLAMYWSAHCSGGLVSVTRTEHNVQAVLCVNLEKHCPTLPTMPLGHQLGAFHEFTVVLFFLIWEDAIYNNILMCYGRKCHDEFIDDCAYLDVSVDTCLLLWK